MIIERQGKKFTVKVIDSERIGTEPFMDMSITKTSPFVDFREVKIPCKAIEIRVAKTGVVIAVRNLSDEELHVITCNEFMMEVRINDLADKAIDPYFRDLTKKANMKKLMEL